MLCVSQNQNRGAIVLLLLAIASVLFNLNSPTVAINIIRDSSPSKRTSTVAGIYPLVVPHNAARQIPLPFKIDFITGDSIALNQVCLV
jgi:hypothetical protein